MTAEERALWARVIASVTPLKRETSMAAPPPPPPPPRPSPPSAPIASKPVAKAPKGRVPPPRLPAPKAAAPRAATLDGGWDRRLSRGLVSPESSIDLHGHTLSSAHALLDRGLDRAILQGDRVLLLITGKPPRPESERPHARGAIRAAVGDWLAASRHADRIAAVRNAHPRHGGQGALYIVLRRDKDVGTARKS
ncbi:Smr/MutS family protein [Sphingomonas turrisvirgatae]|uniref:DNA mismatch repair protein MutS n=1 Tax=Sphingomonas turrisvirgatae TaxID=1888892 RepID=A0A1E3M0D2_9SPHN|nr:Smr/MutS family protein [Sphingomonas turrisvirgatae]ODP39486.1 DNA mismatch repair protein MutS [Sphingomonas turrisvirgatae]